jgi:hypothetical protein
VRRPRTGRAALLAAALLLAGCGAGQPDSAPAPSHEEGPGDTHVDLPSTAPASPTWDEDSAATATATAITALTLYARPGLDEDAWFAELEPHLSEAAAFAYESVDPSTIEITEVYGATASAEPDGSPFLAAVQIGTEDGTCTVRLSRVGAGDPWRVERFVLPETGT